MSPTDIAAYMAHVGTAARAASAAMAAAPTAAKDHALRLLAALLRTDAPELVAANELDLQAAKNLDPALFDRLKLTLKIIDTVAEGCEQIAAMPDPVGEITGVKRRPSGISVGQMRVPLGVFGMIYESRPNVTIEAASLAIKSGNACILRGGSEALQSNLALWKPACRQRLVARRPAGRRGATDRDHRPRRRGPPDHDARIGGRDHPAWRQGPDRAHQPPKRACPSSNTWTATATCTWMPRSIWTLAVAR